MTLDTSKLQIQVIEARDLKAADVGGTSDPYVKIKDVSGLCGSGAKTSWKKKTRNPNWSETFLFEFTYKCVYLRFKVFDHDVVGHDDEIGKCAVPMVALMDGVEHDMWLPLQLSNRGGVRQLKGELHLKLRAQWSFAIAVPGTWLQVRNPITVVGLGWDHSKKKLPIDLDASVVALTHDNTPFCTVSFRSLVGLNGAIKHSGDNRTGEGSGDDEQIMINFQMLPPVVSKIIIVVNSFTGQPLTSVKSAYLRLFDASGTACFFRVAQMVNATGLFFGTFAKHPGNGFWFFQVFGEPAEGRTVEQSMPTVTKLLAAAHF